MRKKFLLLITSSILIISFGLSTLVSLKSLDKLIKENNRENSVIFANEVSNTVLDIFSEAVAVSQAMNNSFVQDLLTTKTPLIIERKNEIIRKYLLEIVSKFGYSTAFLAEDKTMTYYAETGFTKTIDPGNPDDDWYVPFKETGKLYELNVDNDQANNNRITIYINTRMKDSKNNFIGVCGVGVSIRQVMQILGELEDANNIAIRLVSKDGNVRVGRTGQIVMQRTEQEIKEVLKDYNFEEPFMYTPKNEDGYTIIKYIPECEWFAVIDYAGGKTSSLSTMLFKNLLVCLAIMFVVILLFILIFGNYTKHTEKVVEEAMEDQLTGFKNRRAYQEEIERINAKGEYKEVSVVTMDINGLKITNDSFGHTAGDDLIKGGAAIIKEIFCENGWKVFRTGGDEFVALICIPINDIEVLVQDFKEHQKYFSHELIKELSISVGTAQGFNQNGINCVEDLIKIADKRMYADKELFYSQANHERRKR